MVEQSEFPNLPPFNEQEDKIYLKDFDLEQNEHFIKFVFIPYFKDIYNDLADKSENKEKGINKIVFTEYANLPGILSERFFKIIDENGDGFIDQKEFIHAMFKVYYSKLESKIKLVFDIYDFDADGYISKEDIRIVLSHVPISHVNKVLHKDQVKEGKITQEGGGLNIDYQDRIDMQKDILLFLDICFGEREKINITDLTDIIGEKSSEMFLSIMSLIQDNLPSSENFFRFQTHYEKHSQSKEGDSSKKASPRSSPRQIASPKYLKRLSPVQQYIQRSDEIRNEQIKINTEAAQKKLLKYAAGSANLERLQKHEEDEDVKMEETSSQDDEALINSIPIAKFKENQVQMVQGKMRKLEKSKSQEERERYEEEMKNFLQAVRQPNMASKFFQTPDLPASLYEPSSSSQTSRSGYESPTSILSGNQPVLESFRTALTKENVEFQGEMLRKTPENKFKKYWFCLLNKELYCYRKKDDQKHKSMQSLVGAFIKDEDIENLNHNGKNIQFFPIKLIFPFGKSKVLYLLAEQLREKWIDAIKVAIGYSTIEDFYQVERTLGKGQFGLVKLAIHKKTQKKVAIKIIQKRDMKMIELELQRREIEVLKICQHPNIIRLIDVFENHEQIYIVLEYMEGGDLYTYLEKREFKISEDQARTIAHQIAAAVYYLHTYGIVHRDLKLENIMMVDDSNNSDLKLADFGLSKILGPSETSTEPFGTIAYAAPEVLMQKPYGKNVDLWSLGVIIYAILSGSFPFNGKDPKETAKSTVCDEVSFKNPLWNYASDEVKDIIQKLLTKDRFKRISIEEVLTHPWICKRSQDMLQKRQKSGEIDKFNAYTATIAKYISIPQEKMTE